MTLKSVIQAFEVIASNQPAINMIVRNDVFRLNEKADARYGVFSWVQGRHIASLDSNTMRYSFTFFYVDRLKADKSNEIEIQSVGIQTLENIIRTLEDMGIYTDESFSFQVFNQRFLDECAGVFCNVVLSTPVDDHCPEIYGLPDGSYNLDYSESFMIY